jgi:SAM-dependent methyltransferase
MVVQKFKYEPRLCECCGSNELEPLYNFDYVAYTSTKKWQFVVNDVICQNCGFVFVSPVPSANQLLDYYSDAFAKYKGQMLDFNSSKRITFIGTWVKPHLRKTFLELGAHNRNMFHQDLEELFNEVFTVEPNSNATGDFNRLDGFLEGQLDVVAHYFVLEHVPNVRSFMKQCYDLLKPGGILICEVPDLSLYPKDISALILHEHVNHFTPETLKQLCEKIGFKCLETSQKDCSRSFGFVIALEKSSSEKANVDASQYLSNKEAFRAGLRKAELFVRSRVGILQVIEELNAKNQSVLIWGANDNFLRMFSTEEEIPVNAIIVDSNPKKKTFLSNNRVNLPGEVKDLLADISVIVLTTNLHADSILSTLANEYNKTFSKENVYLFDYYDPLN